MKNEQKIIGTSWKSAQEALKIMPVFKTKSVQPKEDVSKKYSPIQTREIHDIILKKGWSLLKGSMKGTKSYAQHMLVYNHPDYITPDGDEIRIILKNSFDRTSALTLMIGIFRTVCSNGLAVTTKDLGSMKSRHLGVNKVEFEEQLQNLLNETEKAAGIARKMKGTLLSNPKKVDLAIKMLEISTNRKRFEINPENLLKVRRPEDKGNSLWNVFNTIQENLIKGGIEVTSKKTGKVKELGAVNNSFKDIKLNVKYFDIAHEFIK